MPTSPSQKCSKQRGVQRFCKAKIRKKKHGSVLTRSTRLRRCPSRILCSARTPVSSSSRTTPKLYTSSFFVNCGDKASAETSAETSEKRRQKRQGECHEKVGNGVCVGSAGACPVQLETVIDCLLHNRRPVKSGRVACQLGRNVAPFRRICR